MVDYGEIFVQADWLEEHLGDPGVAILDVRTGFRPRPPGASDFFSMRSKYEAGHLDGAHYLHMVDDLSDPQGSFPFTALDPNQVRQLLGALGISNEQTLVLYGSDVPPVVHRCWWILAQAGATDVRVLDCTYNAWVDAGRPVTNAPAGVDSKRFEGSARPEWIASKEMVFAAIEDPSIGLVNALTKEQFEGRGQFFGKPGRIPQSISVPAIDLTDPISGALRKPDELQEAFDKAGANNFDHLITYCGGGIAASTAFLALKLIGWERIALYDGSLMEWNEDPVAPIEVGPLVHD